MSTVTLGLFIILSIWVGCWAICTVYDILRR